MPALRDEADEAQRKDWDVLLIHFLSVKNQISINLSSIIVFPNILVQADIYCIACVNDGSGILFGFSRPKRYSGQRV